MNLASLSHSHSHCVLHFPARHLPLHRLFLIPAALQQEVFSQGLCTGILLEISAALMFTQVQ